jgi:hypothetical protein
MMAAVFPDVEDFLKLINESITFGFENGSVCPHADLLRADRQRDNTDVVKEGFPKSSPSHPIVNIEQRLTRAVHVLPRCAGSRLVASCWVSMKMKGKHPSVPPSGRINLSISFGNVFDMSSPVKAVSLKDTARVGSGKADHIFACSRR